MNLSHPPSIKWFGLLALTAALCGCAGMGSVSESTAGKIKITSTPAGAVAYADGAELGATPLEIMPGDHFRSGFAGLSYRYLGKLSLNKAGCETWSTEVNDYILSKDVHVELKCDPNFQPATVPAPVSAPPGDTTSAPASGDQAAERLERIETLHKKGLISDEEYKHLRARILDKL